MALDFFCGLQDDNVSSLDLNVVIELVNQGTIDKSGLYIWKIMF